MEDKTMARYLLISELDTSRTPEDPKAKKTQWLAWQGPIVKALKDGSLKDWGYVAGENRAYAIFEGNAVDLHTLTSSWVPFVTFKVGELLTIEELNKATKALPE
jgi:hypothetical protein